MSSSDLEIKIFHRANILAGKMVEHGISVKIAIKISKYVTSLYESESKREEVFILMNLWEKEKNEEKRNQLLYKMSNILNII